MKILKLLSLIILSLQAQDFDFFDEALDGLNERELVSSRHGGRNGGDGVELEIRLAAKQITSFLNTEKGKEAFPEVPTHFLNKTMKVAKFFTTTDVLIDKYGTRRTCTNDRSKMDVICDLNRWALVKNSKVYYVLIFHEILGLLNLELGYNLDVSNYPISSRLIYYIDEVRDAKVEESMITTGYYAYDKESFGYEVINSKTKESLRVICNQNIENHQCTQFIVVRRLGDKQSPMRPDKEVITYDQLKKIQRNINSLKRMAYAKGSVLKSIEVFEMMMNVNRTLSYSGSTYEVKNKDFKNLENLTNHQLGKI